MTLGMAASCFNKMNSLIRGVLDYLGEVTLPQVLIGRLLQRVGA